MNGRAVFPRLGARARAEGAEVRVWAPRHDVVEVEIDGCRTALERVDQGLRARTVPARAGARYGVFLDGEGPYPDPCSRAQPDGVTGRSEILDGERLTGSIQPWNGVPLEELVLYELHVGTFSAAGTFEGAVEYLAALRSLGIRAIELMPIATFPGSRGWGYDGLYAYAPSPSYGGPEGFAALVDAAHRADLGVVLDVVYNHLGPGSDALDAFGPYLATDQHQPWGPSIDYTQPAVREWAIQNAEMWIRDYRVDGLRLDATHAIVDPSPVHVLEELAVRVRDINPAALIISEAPTGDLRALREWGHDAVWGDELHHAAHVLLTGEHEGYYERYGSVRQLADAICRPEGAHAVVCAQNHDQVGNRAVGDRLVDERLRLAAFCSLTSPGTPMLFMGEEYNEHRPFQFFSDHPDPAVAKATTEGRRAEFAAFSSFAGEIPDPQAFSTFAASKLDRSAADPAMLEYYRSLIALRRELSGPAVPVVVDERRRFLVVRRGSVELAMNFSPVDVDGVAPLSGTAR